MKKCKFLLFGLALPFVFMSCDKPLNEITPGDILNVINPSSAEDKTDTDGDGITDYDEIYKYFTDPSNVDTDGDGWTDSEELNMYTEGSNTFNPLIADVPKLELQIVGKPDVRFVYTTGTSTTVSDSLTTSSGTVHSTTVNRSDSTTQEVVHGWGVKIGESYKFGGGAEGGFTLSGEQSYEGSVTKGDSFTYSKEQSEEFSTSIENGHTREESSEKTLEGGQIKVLVKFKNPSSIAYNVSNVSVTITAISDYQDSDNSAPSPVTTYDFTNVGTIGPKSETGELTLEDDTLTIEETEKLLKWSCGMNVNIAGYTITLTKDGETKDFTGELTKVKAQTAMLSIDYGVGSDITNEKNFISTKNKYNTAATSINNLYKPISIKDLLAVEQITTDDDKLKLDDKGRIIGIRNVNHISYEQGTWFVGHTYTKNNETRTTIYNSYGEVQNGVETDISKIYVQAGDSVVIFYNVDKDNDGVPYNEELLYGTDDNKADTDEDGLTDYEEIYGWIPSVKLADVDLTEKITNDHILKTTRVFSNPVIKDTDGDDIPDNEDPNPVFPKQKEDTTLSVQQYKISETDTFKNLTISDKNTATITVDSDYIYLNLVPKTVFATVGYSLTENGNYKSVSPADPIFVNVGENKIYLLVTAADGVTKRKITIIVKSSFKKLENLELISTGYNGGNVSFTFKSYNDQRVLSGKDLDEGDGDGGILLHISTASNDSNSTYGHSVFSEYIKNASKKLGLSDPGNDFWVDLSESTADLQKGSFLITGLKAQTKYYITAYAYYRHNNTWENTKIASSSVTTAKSKMGTFTFWAHSIYDEDSLDGTTNPEYYWTLSSNESALFNDLTDICISENDSVEFEKHKGQYCCLGKKEIHDTEPTKYGTCSHAYIATYDRTQNHSFILSMSMKEDDKAANPDDNLGSSTMEFKYDSNKDEWTLKWDNPGWSDNKEEKTVKWSKDPSESNVYFDNSEDGRVKFFFGVRWYSE